MSAMRIAKAMYKYVFDWSPLPLIVVDEPSVPEYECHVVECGIDEFTMVPEETTTFKVWKREVKEAV